MKVKTADNNKKQEHLSFCCADDAALTAIYWWRNPTFSPFAPAINRLEFRSVISVFFTCVYWSRWVSVDLCVCECALIILVLISLPLYLTYVTYVVLPFDALVQSTCQVAIFLTCWAAILIGVHYWNISFCLHFSQVRHIYVLFGVFIHFLFYLGRSQDLN